MADNFLQFSAFIPTRTEEERGFVLDRLESHDDDDEGPICEYAPENEGGPVIWVHADDSGDPERLAGIVCEWQTRFGITEPWSLTWAETCSKPRIGEFGGGALVCHKGTDYWMPTARWSIIKAADLAHRRISEGVPYRDCPATKSPHSKEPLMDEHPKLTAARDAVMREATAFAAANRRDGLFQETESPSVAADRCWAALTDLIRIAQLVGRAWAAQSVIDEGMSGRTGYMSRAQAIVIEAEAELAVHDIEWVFLLGDPAQQFPDRSKP